MKFKNPYWTIKSKIQMLENWIIVHSILYYELKESIVPDEMFDKNCNQLVKMIQDNPEEFKQTKYYYCMKDFDGSTGFDLFTNLTKCDKIFLMRVAERLVEQFC